MGNRSSKPARRRPGAKFGVRVAVPGLISKRGFRAVFNHLTAHNHAASGWIQILSPQLQLQLLTSEFLEQADRVEVWSRDDFNIIIRMYETAGKTGPGGFDSIRHCAVHRCPILVYVFPSLSPLLPLSVAVGLG